MPSIDSTIVKLLQIAPPVETLIANGFNEELGKPDNTTLLPLGLDSLEFTCRLHLPRAVLERLTVKGSFIDEPLGFQQVVLFACGTNFRLFEVKITQCTNHAQRCI